MIDGLFPLFDWFKDLFDSPLPVWLLVFAVLGLVARAAPGCPLG